MGYMRDFRNSRLDSFDVRRDAFRCALHLTPNSLQDYDAGDALPMWVDESSNRQHPTQGNVSLQPIVRNDSVGKYLELGTTKYMERSSFGNGWNQPAGGFAQPVTTVAVVRFAAVTSESAHRFLTAGGTGGHVDCGLNVSVSGPFIAAGSTGASGGAPLNDGQWHVVVWAAGASSVSIWVDGFLVLASETQTSGTQPLKQLFIGAGAAGVSPALADLRQLSIFNSELDPPTIAAMTADLGARFNITVEDQSTLAWGCDATSSTSDAVRYWLPEGWESASPLPLVMIHHHHTGNEKIYPGFFTYPLVQACINRGWMVVAENAHGNQWGNSTALADVDAAYDLVAALHPVSDVIHVGTSMGGVPTLMSIPNATTPDIRGVILIDAVTNLITLNQSATYAATTETAYGATQGTLSAGSSAGATSVSSTVSFPSGTKIVIDATGANPEVVTTSGAPAGSGPYTIPVPALTYAHSSGARISNFPGVSANNDPQVRTASAFGSVPMRFYVGATDAAVDPTKNTATFAAKVAASRSEAQVVTCAGTHLGLMKVIPSDAVAFIERCLD